MARPETARDSADEKATGDGGDGAVRRPPRRPAKGVASPPRAPASADRARPAPRAAGPTAVVWRPLTALTANPRNARVHSAGQIAGIAESIAAFGFNAPILVDDAGVVLAGHGRLLAAQSLGLAEAPTIALDHLNPAERRAFMIADNRLSDRSGWDAGRLALELEALKTLDLDFALTATGFDLAEIDLRIGAGAGSKEAGPDEEASAPPGPASGGGPPGAGEGGKKDAAEPPGEDAVSPPGPTRPPGGGAPLPVTRPGDVWALGPHLLLCADADDADNRAVFAAIDAAIRAWQAIAGASAQLDPTHQTFDAVARARRASSVP